MWVLDPRIIDYLHKNAAEDYAKHVSGDLRDIVALANRNEVKERDGLLFFRSKGYEKYFGEDGIHWGIKKKMNIKEIRKICPIHNDIYREYSKVSEDKRPRGRARFQLLKDGRRVGKLYWDKIVFIYDTFKKPFLEIITLNGLELTIWRDGIRIKPTIQMDDTCYIRSMSPSFDEIEFYGEFEYNIKLEELHIR